ncbi:MAG: ABC transporter ATP-binding protein [Erysipelotrichaceae bacterium]|jgi:ATP-binding cassette subfamily B protein|nr:ABC transporter ATP-binding protein [Erysipelotrichaceae bacterium]
MAMGPRKGAYGKPKKGTIKRLIKSLWSNFKVELIISCVTLLLSIFVNLAGSVFANFITQTLTEAIKEYTLDNTVNAFTGSFRIYLFEAIPVNTNITQLVIILALVYVVGVFCSYTWNRTMAIVAQKYLNYYRIQMFSHMQDLPIKYFDTHQNGEIMSLYTNDIDTIRQFVSQSLPNMLATGLTVISTIFVMLSFSVWMTLIIFLGTAAMFLNTKFIGGKASRYFVAQQKSLGKVEGNIEESITGLRVIKVFTHEEESLNDFKAINEELCKNMTVANIHGNIMGPINGNIGNIIYVLVALLGCILYVTPGTYNLSITGGLRPITASTFYSLLVSFLMLSRMFSNNVNNFSQQITFVVMGTAGASRCFDLLDEMVEQDQGYVTLVNIKKHEDGTFEEVREKTRDYAWKYPHKDGSVIYTELKGDIVLDKVDFSYDGTKLVLDDVSVYARPGQKIALVGATGAGKTTITNLINRFYDLADGKIRYDGININKIKKADLRHSLGVILQDVNLFTGTVMDNIRYGRLDASDEEVYEAAKIANAYDFIMRLPQGFNTVLSGDGSNLSQGQRQLISIARAAVADTPVMILDEATSSIDTRTERLVQAGMDKLMENRTTFVIAHRLSTIQNADYILVLDKGVIIERGNHESLIEEKGTYYQLYTGAFELE